jgi:cytochrome c2
MRPPASKCSSVCAPPATTSDRRPRSSSAPRSTDGRKAGTFEGFNYSPANKSSGIVWSEQPFDKYIHAPMQEMPGTRMAFVGIKNDKDIADLWAYLKGFGPDGAKK